jgi:hypothetical protein
MPTDLGAILATLAAQEAKIAALEAAYAQQQMAYARQRAQRPGRTVLRRLGRPLLAATLLALALDSNAFASIPSGSGTFSGCYRSAGGMNPLYVLDTAQQSACPAGMSLTAWSQTGPQGAQGSTGPQGPQGATGAQGPAGPNVDATTSTIGSVLLRDAPTGGHHPVAFTTDSVIPIANGGTGSATKTFVDLSSAQSIGGNKTFTGCLLVGATSCPAPLAVQSLTGGNYLGQFSSPSAIGTWLGLKNSSTGGKEWDLISSGSGNGEGTGQLLFHDNAGPTPLVLSDTQLSMAGTIQSTSGGFQFPDGTVQSTAAVAQPGDEPVLAGLVYPNGTTQSVGFTVVKNRTGNYTVTWPQGHFTYYVDPVVSGIGTATAHITGANVNADGSGTMTVDFGGTDSEFTFVIAQEQHP